VFVCVCVGVGGLELESTALDEAIEITNHQMKKRNWK
jgi:hypothetical protein